MYFIILSTAATLFKAGKTDINTAADAAQALRPLAGNAAGLLFALGVVGLGFLAVPVMTIGACIRSMSIVRLETRAACETARGQTVLRGNCSVHRDRNRIEFPRDQSDEGVGLCRNRAGLLNALSDATGHAHYQ
jgi:Mn2+/Fe2+ NRAMP family transporter